MHNAMKGVTVEWKQIYKEKLHPFLLPTPHFLPLFYCNFPYSLYLASNIIFQAASFLSIALFTASIHHTLLGVFPLTLNHSMFQLIPFYSLILQTPVISFSVLIFPQFLISNLCSLSLSLLNPCTHQPDFTK